AHADGGRAFTCSAARAGELSVGTYYVRVRQSQNVSTQGTLSFPYGMQVPPSVPACGDGVLDVGEQCDDGNDALLDGCDADCQFETVAEEEPNHTGPLQTEASPRNRGNNFGTTSVNGPFSDDVVISAALTPAGDEDVY